MRNIILILLCLLSFSLVVYAVIPSQDYNDALTRSVTDSLYCKVAADCVLGNVIVQNLSVIGTFFNVTVTEIYINSTIIEGLNDTIEEFGDNNYLKLNVDNGPLTDSLKVMGVVSGVLSDSGGVPTMQAGTGMILWNNMVATNNVYIQFLSGTTAEAGINYETGNMTKVYYDRSTNTFKWKINNKDIMKLNSDTLTVIDTGLAGNKLIAPRIDVDTLTLNNNRIMDSTGEIEFGNENLVTTEYMTAKGFNGTLNGNVNGGNGSFNNVTVSNDLFVGNDIWATGHTATRFIHWDKSGSGLNIVGGGPGGRKALNITGSVVFVASGAIRPSVYPLSLQSNTANYFLQICSSVINDECFFFGEEDTGSRAGNPAGTLYSTEGPLRIYAANDNDAGVYNDIVELTANNASFDGNVFASNVFLPQYIFSHTNHTIPVLGANLWTNVTFFQEDSDIKMGITHIYNDATNDTFTILEDGVYNIDYDFDVEDTSAGASDIDVAGRLIYKNGTEIAGSIFEIDVTKQGTEVELSHNFLARLTASNELVFQFVATDADIQISTHGNFGEYPESATILMNKISNT